MRSHFSFWRDVVSYKNLPALVLIAVAPLVSGCGGSSTKIQALPGNATVTVLATSTANDQLSKFRLDIKSITLTNQTGEAVNLFPAPEHIEFLHLNGTAEPLFTFHVPQDTYLSATATIGPAEFVCESGNSRGTETTDALSYGYTPASNVAVTLPSPLEVNTSGILLSLNLLVSQSASWTSTLCTDNENLLITPTFSLAAATSSSLTNMRGLRGMVASVNPSGNSLVVTAADASGTGVNDDGSIEDYVAPSWMVSTSDKTVFQGLAGLSAVTAGMPIEMDAILQQDGSLAATRIQVTDTDPNSLTVFTGPLLVVRSDNPVVYAEETEEEGYMPIHLGGDYLGGVGFDYDNAVFQVSGGLANLQELPFTPDFGVGSIVDGQHVSITMHQTDPPDVNLGFPATTITLVPQTINGTVIGIGDEAGFKTYTVSLASYDLFPQLAVQNYQTTVLSDPSTVIVYADSNTRMLNTKPIAAGETVRFNGAIFNDNGTLRMDCLQINDGVPE